MCSYKLLVGWFDSNFNSLFELTQPQLKQLFTFYFQIFIYYLFVYKTESIQP